MRLLEWVFLSAQSKRTVTTRMEVLAQLIMRGRNRIVEIAGKEPSFTIIPLVAEYLAWALSQCILLQVALLDYSGEVKVHYPPHKFFSVLHSCQIEERPRRSARPVDGATVFTDAGGRSQKAAITWQANGPWHDVVLTDCQGSTQHLELRAVVEVFARWKTTPVNVVCDSLYVVGVVSRIERALLKEINDEVLYKLFRRLWLLLSERQCEYFITHIRSHTGIIEGLAEGNRRADKLVVPLWAAPSTDRFAQARRSHDFFHQSAKVRAV